MTKNAFTYPSPMKIQRKPHRSQNNILLKIHRGNKQRVMFRSFPGSQKRCTAKGARKLQNTKFPLVKRATSRYF